MITVCKYKACPKCNKLHDVESECTFCHRSKLKFHKGEKLPINIDYSMSTWADKLDDEKIKNGFNKNTSMLRKSDSIQTLIEGFSCSECGKTERYAQKEKHYSIKTCSKECSMVRTNRLKREKKKEKSK